MTVARFVVIYFYKFISSCNVIRTLFGFRLWVIVCDYM